LSTKQGSPIDLSRRLITRSNKAVSYAGADSRLIARLPDALKPDAGVRPTFEHEANPQTHAERLAMEQSEAQRRGEQDPGSMMVKLHKPFPDLKPKYHVEVLRAHFNQQWFQEKRNAQMRSHQEQGNKIVGATHQHTQQPSIQGPTL